MNSNCPERDSSLSDPDSENGGITRRDLLIITAKSAAGLTIAPLSSVLANTQEDTPESLKAMMSELLSENTPIGFSITSSATSAICSLAGDIDGDCSVDEDDLEIMASEWLTNDASAKSNLDDSYTYIPGSASSAVFVDIKDYSILANDWKKSCSACSAISFANFNRPVRRRFTSSARRRFDEIVQRRIQSVWMES